MGIEDTLDKHREALEANTNALVAHTKALGGKPAAAASTKKKKTAAVVDDEEEDEDEEADESDEDEEEDEDESEGEGEEEEEDEDEDDESKVTVSDVRAELRKLKSAAGEPAVIKVFKALGARTVTAIKPKDFARAISLAKKGLKAAK